MLGQFSVYSTICGIKGNVLCISPTMDRNRSGACFKDEVALNSATGIMEADSMALICKTVFVKGD
jgi:hypothetical protein